MKAVILALLFGAFYYTQFRYFVSKGYMRDLLVFTVLYVFSAGLVIAESLGAQLPDVAWVTGKAVVSLFGIKVE